MYLTSFVHREDLFKITERWLCGRLEPEDGARISEILVCDGFVLGEILDEVETVLNFARSMTWNEKHPVVALITEVYHKGVRLSARAMREIEAQVERLPKLGRWFVDIHGERLRLG